MVERCKECGHYETQHEKGIGCGAEINPGQVCLCMVFVSAQQSVQPTADAAKTTDATHSGV